MRSQGLGYVQSGQWALSVCAKILFFVTLEITSYWDSDEEMSENETEDRTQDEQSSWLFWGWWWLERFRIWMDWYLIPDQGTGSNPGPGDVTRALYIGSSGGMVHTLELISYIVSLLNVWGGIRLSLSAEWFYEQYNLSMFEILIHDWFSSKIMFQGTC